ncbi:ABC transporter substrate-binding protein [Novimethylophilus kurashikiensis]|uniref:ABC transporter substrate-binding protein n=1 Tax=Novimethylophilus kurashikiensis TaxID=1825523 RepID=A0A2R5F2L4_9PROT|nr:substrate-binding domain-containing protein [Novimethylophilus kurashikiensis]GBG12836.1 ABC transporter substrate-binding protein [Novimethylophilus kurashikiensis]
MSATWPALALMAALLAATCWLMPLTAKADTTGAALRVCADPNNMPFSNAEGRGFENRLAELMAQALGKHVEYTWWAQRRGFVRNTLNAGACDIVMGLPAASDHVLATRAYYRSGYVLVTRQDRNLNLSSLDDPRLQSLKIGVHLIGDNSTPPVLALARRGIVNNVLGYSIFGDYREPNPPARLIEAVADGEVDVALAWGPLAGYFASHSAVPLEVIPLADDPRDPPFRFSIAMGVRPGDTALKRRLDTELERHCGDIDALLRQYGVPLLDNADNVPAAGLK